MSPLFGKLRKPAYNCTMNIISWPHTPLGPLWAALDGHDRLTSLQWGEAPANATIAASHPLAQPLQAYFDGKKSLPPGLSHYLALQGTPFQQRVWQALLEIPHGQTLTYGQLAGNLATSPRALGSAVGANPIPVIVPCHRVIGQNGKLTGFSAPGGIATKRWLLNHEGVQC